MKFWPLIFGASLLAASGCVHYQPRPLASDTSAAQFEARRLDDPGLKAFITTNSRPAPEVWPLVKWDFATLNLAAFYFHPDLAVARAQWQLAEAGVKTAGGRPNPTVTVTPEYNSTTLIPTPWGPSVSIDVPVETAGKRGKRIAEAEKISESARWNFVSAAWAVRSGVRNALADYLMVQRRLPLLQRQLVAQGEIVRLMQNGFDAGETSRPELTTAQMVLSRLQLDASAAGTQALTARSRLAEAIGVSGAALENIPIAAGSSSGPTVDLASDAARHAALLGRADIRAALADYAAAESDLQLEIAKQYPDVHLNPGYQFDQGDNKWSIGLTVELPVFNQNQGPIAEARARRELAAAKFLQLQAQVIAQVERALTGWQSARTQMKTAGELLAAAERQQKSISGQVKAGAASKADLAAAEIEFVSAQLAQLDNEAQAQTALGALEDALQSPAGDLAAVIKNISTVTPQAKASHP